jgi:hypothetical protein
MKDGQDLGHHMGRGNEINVEYNLTTAVNPIFSKPPCALSPTVSVNAASLYMLMSDILIIYLESHFTLAASFFNRPHT